MKMKWLFAVLMIFSANLALAAAETQPLLRGSYQKIVAAHTGKPFIIDIEY